MHKFNLLDKYMSGRHQDLIIRKYPIRKYPPMYSVSEPELEKIFTLPGFTTQFQIEKMLKSIKIEQSW